MYRRFDRYRIKYCLPVFLLTLTLGGNARAEPATPSRAEIDGCVRDAKQKVKSGDIEGAESRLLSCLLQAPGQPLLLARLSLVRLLKDDLDGALQTCEQSLENGLRGGNRRKIRNICRDLRLIRKTRLRIEVLNGPADIYVGSKSYGPRCKAATFCELGRYPGELRIYIERDGFEPVDERVKIRKNRVTVVKRTLREEDSVLDLTVEPEGATVVLDGTEYQPGQIPRTLPAGEYVLKVSKEGCLFEERKVVAKLGKPLTISVELQPIVQMVQVEVVPPDAKLRLNDEPVQLQDGKLAVDTRVDNELKAKRDGYETAYQKFAANAVLPPKVAMVLQEIPAPVMIVGPKRNDRWSTSKHATVWTTAGLSGALLISGSGLSLSARSMWADAAEQLSLDAATGAYSQVGLDLRDEARARTAQADYAFAAGSLASLGLLVSLNQGGGKPLPGLLLPGAAGGIALLGLGVGGFYAWHAGQARASATDSADLGFDDDYRHVLDTRASDMSRRAWLGFAVAGGAAATAAYLWWTKPGRDNEETALLPALGPDYTGLALTGRL